jgi:uncharacterized protein with FMN-binding domain
MKQFKYLVQIVPAAALLLTAAFGFQESAPVLESIDSTAAAAVQCSLSQMQTNQSSEEELAVGEYEDGTYEGVGTGYRGEVKVEVVVEEHQITTVTVLSHVDDSSFFNRAKALIDTIIQKQTWEVDSVSGATYSSRGIKEAVENALTGATFASSVGSSGSESGVGSTVGSDFEEPEGGYNDGTYYGTATGFGGPITVKVVISSGKMKSISIVSAEKETPSYFSQAKTIIQRILNAQSPNVDTVSGATYSSNGIREAVKKALKQAAKSGNSASDEEKEDNKKTPNQDELTQESGKQLDGTYNDGTYTGVGYGYHDGEITVQVTIKNNSITALKIVSANSQDEPFFGNAKALLGTVLSEQSTNVDAVSGATFSSGGILQAIEDALRQAKVADDEEQNTEDSDSDSENSNDTDNSTGDADDSTAGEDNGEDSGEQDTEDPAPAPKRNGTYTGSATCEPDKWKEFKAYTVSLTVTFTDGEVTSISDPTYTDKSNFWYMNEAASSVLPSLKSRGTADAVSEATCSSKALVNAFNDACRKADADLGG